MNQDQADQLFVEQIDMLRQMQDELMLIEGRYRELSGQLPGKKNYDGPLGSLKTAQMSLGKVVRELLALKKPRYTNGPE